VRDAKCAAYQQNGGEYAHDGIERLLQTRDFQHGTPFVSSRGQDLPGRDNQRCPHLANSVVHPHHKPCQKGNNPPSVPVTWNLGIPLLRNEDASEGHIQLLTILAMYADREVSRSSGCVVATSIETSEPPARKRQRPTRTGPAGAPSGRPKERPRARSRAGRH